MRALLQTFYMNKQRKPSSRYIVEQIKRRRTNKKTKVYQYLVKWQGWPNRFNSWQPRRHLRELHYELEKFDKFWNEKEQKQQIERLKIRIEAVGDVEKREEEDTQEVITRPRKRTVFRLRRTKKSKLGKVNSEEGGNGEKTVESLGVQCMKQEEEREVAKLTDILDLDLPGSIKIVEGRFGQNTMVYKINREDRDPIWATRQQLEILRPQVLNAFYNEYM